MHLSLLNGRGGGWGHIKLRGAQSSDRDIKLSPTPRLDSLVGLKWISEEN